MTLSYNNLSKYAPARKADFLAADLSAGGLMPTSRRQEFIVGLTDKAVLLNDIDFIPMTAAKEEIHKMDMADGILKSTSSVNLERNRVQSSDRSKPTTTKIDLDAVLFRGEVTVDYATLEDNIEKDGFMEKLHGLIGKKVQKDLEGLIINGNTGGSTGTILDDVDGTLVRAVSSIYDAGGQAISLKVLQETSKTVPTKFEQDEDAYMYYFNTRVLKDYGTYLSARQDRIGEDAVDDIHGRRVAAGFQDIMRGTAVMTKTNGIYCNPKNIILGMHRDVSIVATNRPEESQIIISISVRCDVNLVQEEGVVKIINLAA